MTEAEFSHLLSQLADTAKILNQKSESLNRLIERFQGTLRTMNIGLEVWPVELDSVAWADAAENEDGLAYQRELGTVDTELGFTKYDGKWVLATRRVRYSTLDVLNNVITDPHLYSVEEITPLLEASRDTRTQALAYFPKIAAALKAEADEAIKTIENAEKFVMVSPQPTELEQFAKAVLKK